MSRPTASTFVRTSFIIPLVLALLLGPTTVSAQAGFETFDKTKAPTAQNAVVRTDTNLDSCFLYYTFGSTPVVLTAELASVSIGVPFAVSGSVTNQNKYPIVDATVYVKVMRQRSVEKDVNGPDIVDFFPVLEHVNLKAGETLPLQFTWNVPADAAPGQYRMAAYVTQKDRFNFLGLSFTDDVTGGFYQFKVIGDSAGPTRFDKGTATINDHPYYFAAFPQTLPPDLKETAIKIDVENTGVQNYSGEVHWKLYYWDGIREDHLIDQKTERVEVGAGTKASVSYALTDTSHSVYYLVGELKTPAGSKSIVGIRFARRGIDTPRINSLNVTEYPTTAESKAFACFHDAGLGEAAGTRVDVWMKEPLFFGLIGIPLSHQVYEGVAPSQIVALTMPVAKAGLTSFDLVAKVSQNGKTIDKITIPYRCNQLGGACQAPSLMAIGIYGVTALLLIGIVVLVYLRTRPKPHVPTPLVPPSSL